MSSDTGLKVFRDKIDQIDTDIVDLIKQRMSIVKEVGLYKESVNDDFFIKSAREVDMIRDLTKSLDGIVDKKVVFNIWRSLIVSANVAEQDLSVYIHNPQKNAQLLNIASNYYANLLKIVEINDIDKFLSLKNDGVGRILGISTKVNDGSWQKILDKNQNLKIFAKIGDDNNELYLLAQKPVEKSNKDNSVFCVDGKLIEVEGNKNIDDKEGFLGVFGVVDK